MNKKKFTKFFSSIVALVMMLSLLLPFSNVNAVNTKISNKDTPSESTIQLKAAIAEQKLLSQAEPTLHKSLQNIKGDKEISVIVHLSDAPVAVEQGISQIKGKSFSTTQQKKVRVNVKSQQMQVQKDLANKKVQIKQGYTFNTVLNGFSAKVKAKDLPKLLNTEGVTLIEPDTIVQAEEIRPTNSTNINSTKMGKKDTLVEPFMNMSTSFLGIEKLWKEGFEGQGIKVAVLDTGIDADHPDFAGIYKGGKNFIPNSSAYTKNRADNDASETSPAERSASSPERNSNGTLFHTSHGTHVAGTIAAIGANEYGIKGIAPKIDLYAYRVLGAYGSSAASSVIKGIETAVIEKMDVINLSLGNASNIETNANSFAINNAMIAGTISVVSAGNSGSERSTVGSPGTSRLGITVGNTTNAEKKYAGNVNINVPGINYNLTKELPLMATTFGVDLATQLQGDFELVAVPGLGYLHDYENINVEGKIALITRGTLPFVDKIANAKAKGAVGAIIHNSATGTNTPNISKSFVGDSFELLPTFDMSYTDGNTLRSRLSSYKGQVNFTNFTSTTTAGDEVNSSSSRGPSIPNFDIKPDVTAPGTNIMSTIPMYKADFPDAVYDQAFERYTGTSMAAPHISAIAALIKQANPTWNAFDVKVALSNTAKVLDTSKYDVFDQGAGRVNAYAAAHPEILAYSLDKATLDSSGTIVDNLKGTVTFGPQSIENGNISVTKQILVKDIKGNGGNYNVSVDVLKTYGDAKITVAEPSFNLNGEKVINITLTASQVTSAPIGSEILGYIKITNDSTSVSLPFAADFSNIVRAEIKNFKASETDISLNGDGVKDSTLLSYTLTEDVDENYIEIKDLSNPTSGYYEDGSIGYVQYGNSLLKNSYSLKFSGQYRTWDTYDYAVIPDGLYTFDFFVETVGIYVADFVGPIIVKSTEPEIRGSIKDLKVKGQVRDKYIDYNKILADYNLQYELNDKLKASYIATIEGVVQKPVSFKLKSDGSYSFPIELGTDKVSVTVEDAAGNISKKTFNQKVAPVPVISLAVNKTKVETSIGKEVKVKIIETTKLSGKSTTKDVTKNASYTVANKKIATVKKGIIKGKVQGKTSVTATYGGKKIKFDVNVSKSPKYY